MANHMLMYDGQELVKADALTHRNGRDFYEFVFPEDVPLEDVCAVLYQWGGAWIVLDLVSTHYPRQKWGACDPCGLDVPLTDSGLRCLVCGSGEVRV